MIFCARVLRIVDQLVGIGDDCVLCSGVMYIAGLAGKVILPAIRAEGHYQTLLSSPGHVGQVITEYSPPARFTSSVEWSGASDGPASVQVGTVVRPMAAILPGGPIQEPMGSTTFCGEIWRERKAHHIESHYLRRVSVWIHRG